MLLFPSVSFSGLIFNSNTLDSLIKADTGLQPVIAQEGLIANAGPDQTVSPEDKVTLDGTDSKGGNLTYYNWEQTDDGPEIVDFDESDDTKPKRTFTAPSVNQTTELMFELTVENEHESQPDSVTITVKPRLENPQPHELVLEIKVEKDPINVGDKQTITITAVDKSSNEKVTDATINGKVTSNSYTKKFSDNDGEALYSWKIGSKTDPGKFNVIADASADGYGPGHGSKTFNVISKKEPSTNGGTDGGGTGEDGRHPVRDPSTDESDVTFNATLSNVKDLVSDLKQKDLSQLLPFIGLGAAALAVAYGIYRSKKSKHKGGNVAVITRGGIE